jgi:hypothetical protein
MLISVQETVQVQYPLIVARFILLEISEGCCQDFKLLFHFFDLCVFGTNLSDAAVR